MAFAVSDSAIQWMGFLGSFLACCSSCSTDANICLAVLLQFSHRPTQLVNPADRTGQTVAIVGSGPAGLAAADELNQLGHTVTVFEREDNIGGLLYYGIPNPKLDKRTVDRRVDLLREEGVVFQPNSNVGAESSTETTNGRTTISAAHLENSFDAVLLAVGATKPRVLTCPGGDLKGSYPFRPVPVLTLSIFNSIFNSLANLI